MSPRNSKIVWPERLTATPEMSYESIVPLYEQSAAIDHSAFAVSCSKHFMDPAGCRGCIHKLEVGGSPNYALAKLHITHEVLPNQGACSQLIHVNKCLRVACFDSGTLIAIKNFGHTKTFNCDVRGGLQHHSAPINCIASDSKGTQLASGSTDGEIALYKVDGERIDYLARAKLSDAFITGLAYLQPIQDICSRPNDEEVFGGQNLLIYSTQNGHIGLIDTRVKLGNHIDSFTIMTTEPRLNLTSLCLMNNLPGQTVNFGTIHGRLIGLDLRCNNRYLYDQNLPEDGCIRRMKEVVISDGNGDKKTFLAYTNGTKEIRILDAQTMKPHPGWICERAPGSKIQDLCQIGAKIVTCGENTSIGSWNYSELS